jgi:hypothetical protein
MGVVTEGLDVELARLQDRGTGGMTPPATPRQRWICGAEFMRGRHWVPRGPGRGRCRMASVAV